jgi:hypothetical protein
MRHLHDNPRPHSDSRSAKHRCSHPLALVIDPTDREISELEQMLANCPSCSQWSPGDGPIMAVLLSHNDGGDEEPKKIV